MQHNKNNLFRVLSWVLIAILVIAFLLYLVLPAVFGVAALVPRSTQVGDAPKDFEDVTLTTNDGVELKAWYKPASNGAAIILMHGAGDSRENLRPYLAMLERHGYGVLAIDQRGHGQSAGNVNRLGWQGNSDVGAALAFLQDKKDVKAVGALGLSMGGEVLLGAASQFPSIRAIAADGATRRSIQELLALESERSLVRNFTARVMYATVQMISGERPPKPMLDSMVESDDTVYLLIAGGNKELEVKFNRLFVDALDSRASLWIAPETGHIEAYRRFPEQYEQHLINFFDSALVEVTSRSNP
jgi:pimeloyl-ACP methyl ester carboxylesterase